MANNTSVTLKSKLKGHNDLRRVTVPTAGLDFEAFKQKLTSLYKYRDLTNAVIKYQDPENDRVTITSDEELKEALSLVGSDNILRVFITPSEPKKAEPSQTTNFDELLEHARSKIIAEIANPALEQEVRSCMDEVANNLPPFFARCPRAQWKIVKLMRRNVFRHLNHRAFKLLDSSKPEDLKLARDFFTAQLNLWPEHAVTTYNLACAESLLGNKDAACAALRKAIDLGYRDVAHMKVDKDLDNIRNELVYVQLVSELEAAKQQRPCHWGRRHGKCHRFGGHGRGFGGHGRRWGKCGRFAQKEAVAPEPKAEIVVVPEPKDVVKPEVVEEPEVVVVLEEPEVVVEDAVEPEVVVDLDAVEEEIPAGVTQSAIDTANEFARSLESLAAMGFTDRKKNIAALVHARGNMTGAVQHLLNN